MPFNIISDSVLILTVAVQVVQGTFQVVEHINCRLVDYTPLTVAVVAIRIDTVVDLSTVVGNLTTGIQLTIQVLLAIAIVEFATEERSTTTAIVVRQLSVIRRIKLVMVEDRVQDQQRYLEVVA